MCVCVYIYIDTHKYICNAPSSRVSPSVAARAGKDAQ